MSKFTASSVVPAPRNRPRRNGRGTPADHAELEAALQDHQGEEGGDDRYGWRTLLLWLRGRR